MVPLALSLIPSLIQIGQSINQKQKAKSLQQSNYVPPSIQNAVANAQFNANSPTAPGYNQALSNLKTSTANNISNAKKVASNAAQLSSAATEGDAREKQALQGLQANNQGFQFNNRQDLLKWLGIRGQSEQENYNRYNAAKSALIGASQQNMYNAATGAAMAGLVAADKGNGLEGITLGGQPTSNMALGGVGSKALGGTSSGQLLGGTALGGGGNTNSVVGKNGMDLLKMIKAKGGAGFDDNEKSYLQSLGYNVSPNGEIVDYGESPNLQVFEN